MHESEGSHLCYCLHWRLSVPPSPITNPSGILSPNTAESRSTHWPKSRRQNSVWGNVAEAPFPHPPSVVSGPHHVTVHFPSPIFRFLGPCPASIDKACVVPGQVPTPFPLGYRGHAWTNVKTDNREYADPD